MVKLNEVIIKDDDVLKLPKIMFAKFYEIVVEFWIFKCVTFVNF